MDCEKFENLLIDELYGELDEVTSAAVRRHAAGCARCGALLSGLKATRKVAALPVEQPSIDLEDRIMAAVREQQKVLPFRARMSTALSRAGAWAMRPQTAMAAVFLVVIGTSFVLVQSRKQMSPAGAPSRALNAEGQPVAAAQGAIAATAAASALALESKEGAFAHGIEDRDQQRARTITTSPSSLAEALAADDLSKDKTVAKNEEKKADNGYGYGEHAKPTTNADGIANAGPIGGSSERSDLDNRPGASNMRAGGGGAGSGGAVQSQTMTTPMQQAPAATSTAAAQSRVAINCQQYDANRAQGGPAGNAATLDAGRCYKALGNAQLARQRFASLAGTPLAPVAQNELDAMTPLAARKAPVMPHANATTATPTATVQAAPPVKANADHGL